MVSWAAREGGGSRRAVRRGPLFFCAHSPGGYTSTDLAMDNKSRARLVQLLIAKSVGESLLVCALAMGFFFVAFPPYFHGWGEATSHAIAGWAVNRHKPWQRVELQLFIDDRFVASGVADQSRPDIVAAGKAQDEWHGYAFEVPRLREGRHTARIYATSSCRQSARKSLQQVGDSISFEVDASGISHSLDKKR